MRPFSDGIKREPGKKNHFKVILSETAFFMALLNVIRMQNGGKESICYVSKICKLILLHFEKTFSFIYFKIVTLALAFSFI